MAFIPYGRQSISDEDIAAVIRVLKSDFLTQGPAVPNFEEKISTATCARHAVAVNSATSALHIACLALGLGPGDWLWTSPVTFVASANCGLYCGARVDFVDIDPRSYNLDPDRLEEKLLVAEREGRLPKVVVPVHLTGQSCDMERIYRLSQKYGFRVIEDASHAIGASYKGRPVGDCRYSDICVFSFHPVKIVTSAEGGVATTQDEVLAERMRLLRSHGITRDDQRLREPSHGGWYYEQQLLGFNYRMTDMQAALGASQMDRLAEFIDMRHLLADRYDRLLDLDALQLPVRLPDRRSSLHLYVIRLAKGGGGIAQRALFDHLREAEIGANLHYIPVYRQPYYREMGFDPSDFPQAEAYYREAITIPLFPAMNEEQQDYVIAAIRKAIC